MNYSWTKLCLFLDVRIVKTIEVDPRAPGNRDEFPFPQPKRCSPELDSLLCSVQAQRLVQAQGMLPDMRYIDMCRPKG